MKEPIKPEKDPPVTKIFMLIFSHFFGTVTKYLSFSSIMVRKRLTSTFRVQHKWFIALVSLGKQTPPNPRKLSLQSKYISNMFSIDNRILDI